jgi:hypothetical protein
MEEEDENEEQTRKVTFSVQPPNSVSKVASWFVERIIEQRDFERNAQILGFEHISSSCG